MQCANTACDARFKPRNGRLFYLHVPHGKSHPIRHFWLCRGCSTKFTVEVVGDHTRLRTITAPHHNHHH